MKGYKTKEEIMKRIHEHKEAVEDQGQLFGIFLQGSQNYSNVINDIESDIDTKAIFLPTFEELCLNTKPMSKTITLENNEQVDCKDIRQYLHLFKKMNINILEILFTKYYYINPKYESYANELFALRERIARAEEKRLLLATMGMSMQKNKLLTKPTPATKDVIDLHGFDGKQLSHIIRLNHFSEAYVKGLPFKECLLNNDSDYLRKVKRNEIYTKKVAIHLANEYVEETARIAHNFPQKPIDEELGLILDYFVVRFLGSEYGLH